MNMTPNRHIYAMRSGPEVVGDVISGKNVNMIDGDVLVNFGVASSSSF